MSLIAEAAVALISMLEDEWQAIVDGDKPTLVRLREHAKILCGRRFESPLLQTRTTSLEYVMAIYNCDDAIVHAAIPCLIDFEWDESRANTMSICLHNGLIESFHLLMVTYKVPAPRDALLIAFESKEYYKALRRLIAINACDRGADIRCQDRHGNNILHLICADIPRIRECDPIVVAMLLRLGADPRQRNTAGKLPIHCMLAMRLEIEQEGEHTLVLYEGFLKSMREVQRLLMQAADDTHN